MFKYRPELLSTRHPPNAADGANSDAPSPARRIQGLSCSVSKDLRFYRVCVKI